MVDLKEIKVRGPGKDPERKLWCGSMALVLGGPFGILAQNVYKWLLPGMIGSITQSQESLTTLTNKFMAFSFLPGIALWMAATIFLYRLFDKHLELSFRFNSVAAWNLPISIVASYFARRGECYSKKGEYEKALEYHKKSYEYSTEDSDSMIHYYCMAHTLAKLGRYQEARVNATKSLDSCDQFPEMGGVVQDLRNRVNEVLEYIDHMEKQPEQRSH